MYVRRQTLEETLEKLRNNEIISLDRRLNRIGDDIAGDIANALKENTSLRSLCLDCNYIGAFGAHYIAKALGSVNKVLAL